MPPSPGSPRRQSVTFRIVPVWLVLAVGVVLAEGPPETTKKPVSNIYHGVRVSDPYRWLEETNTPALRGWLEAQNDHREAFLKRLKGLSHFRDRLMTVYKDAPPSFDQAAYDKGVLIAIHDENLVVLKSEDDPEPIRTLVDYEKFTPNTETHV